MPEEIKNKPRNKKKIGVVPKIVPKPSERAVFYIHKNPVNVDSQGFQMVCPAGFEPVTFRVGGTSKGFRAVTISPQTP